MKILKEEDDSEDIEGLPDDIFADYIYKKEGSLKDLSYYGSSLILNNKISIRHYFKVQNGTATDYIFKVDGSVVVPVNKGGLCYVDVKDITPGKILDSYKLTVSKENVIEQPQKVYGIYDKVCAELYSPDYPLDLSGFIHSFERK